MVSNDVRRKYSIIGGNMMKMMRKAIVLILAVMMLFGLTACGGDTTEAQVKKYTMDGKFNSEEANWWRNLYLVDEDTYILEIEVLDSQNPELHTVEFVMRGQYTLNEDKITLTLGDGNGYVMNGQDKIACVTGSEGWERIFDAMFGVNGATTFTLRDDGTYVPAGK